MYRYDVYRELHGAIRTLEREIPMSEHGPGVKPALVARVREACAELAAQDMPGAAARKKAILAAAAALYLVFQTDDALS